MQVIHHGPEGLIEIVPDIFFDERGYFFESFHAEKWREVGIPSEYLQDNVSFSKRGVVRGLHFQLAPYAQGKLVRVSSGKVLDVAVDIRLDSPTFGEVVTCILDAKRHNCLYIPEGFAHGFAALEDSLFVYKCTNVYHKASERGIKWDDPQLTINWQVEQAIVSAKDQILPSFEAVMEELKSL